MESADSSAVNRKVLLIFAKLPNPGTTKTRLSPHLSPRQAAEAYEAMLQDALALTAEVPGVERWICYSPEGERAAASYFTALVPDLHRHPQQGNDLGDRLAEAFAAAFATGADQVVVIGTDSPDLPPDFIRQAFDQLAAADVVLGPTADGGYYLLGASRLWPVLFREIPWSTADVLSASLRAAKAAGLRTVLLPKWHDVDTVEDLLRVAASPGTSAPRTRSFLYHCYATGSAPST